MLESGQVRDGHGDEVAGTVEFVGRSGSGMKLASCTLVVLLVSGCSFAGSGSGGDS